MTKRGEVQPYRVKFKFPSGSGLRGQGVIVCSSVQVADLRAREQLDRGADIEIFRVGDDKIWRSVEAKTQDQHLDARTVKISRRDAKELLEMLSWIQEQCPTGPEGEPLGSQVARLHESIETGLALAL
jgi:hypothetical protein